MYASKDTLFENLETNAREANHGLLANVYAGAPWVWRKSLLSKGKG